MSRDLIDPDMPAQELRLHMGEMTAQEMRTARAAIRWANTRLRAALEAEASEGERRGLEPTDAMMACFSDPMLNPEWVRSRLRAALALIPAPAREGWQPIETAPKDVAILVYDQGQGRCIAYWAQWHDNLLGEDRQGWRTMGDWDRLDSVRHWMSIPGPPPQDREEQ